MNVFNKQIFIIVPKYSNEKKLKSKNLIFIIRYNDEPVELY